MARAVWVYVDLETGVAACRCRRDFFEVYGEDARAHKVSAKLRHPRAADGREAAAVAACGSPTSTCSGT